MEQNEKARLQTLSFNITVGAFALAVLTLGIIVISTLHIDMAAYSEQTKTAWVFSGFIAAIYTHLTKKDGIEFSFLLYCLFFGFVALLTVIYTDIYFKFFFNKLHL